MSSFSSGWCRDWFRWREHKNPDDCVTDDDQQQRQLPLIKALKLNLKSTAKRRALKELSINFFVSFSTFSFWQELLQVTYFGAHILKGVHTFFSSLDHQNNNNLAVQVAVQGETKSLGGSGQLSNTAVAVSPFSSSNVRRAWLSFAIILSNQQQLMRGKIFGICVTPNGNRAMTSDRQECRKDLRAQ